MPYTSSSGGPVPIPTQEADGSAAAPAYSFSADTSTGFWRSAAGTVRFSSSGADRLILANLMAIGPNPFYGGSTIGATTTALSYTADNVWRTTAADGSVASWLQETAATGALAADYTNATTTFTNTNLSRTVISGRTYSFQVCLFITQATAASGVKIDFNGGTAAATNFVVNAWLVNETGGLTALAAASSTTLAGVINATTTVTTGQQNFVFNGSFVPSGNGTFIVRAADNSGVTTLTIKRGSWILMNDVPAL